MSWLKAVVEALKFWGVCLASAAVLYGIALAFWFSFVLGTAIGAAFCCTVLFLGTVALIRYTN